MKQKNRKELKKTEDRLFKFLEIFFGCITLFLILYAIYYYSINKTIFN